jgi:hypothetical protein
MIIHEIETERIGCESKCKIRFKTVGIPDKIGDKTKAFCWVDGKKNIILLTTAIK